MGKTFRRGGAERGYYSPGKSLRDKRQRGGGSNRTTSWEEENYSKKNKSKKESFDNLDGEWS